ncbi:inorganic triphosphatase YgiF [Rhizomicrobium palustre]|uniref:Inorganic triphosphatase YgiF n=1 Tax=Rhizomicrobium palustre TaxID=189966 RepID=A0A846MW30_9PROT|nr:CYTH and CHAD domain-containing protein [Rhizomicrobium palustre]NIK87197.1 inorganic triphosphatase YgiF [Rhizomicrobium palustre]
MADEIEIKLAVPPEALKAVTRLDWLKNTRPKRKTLRSVYFDTPKLTLQGKGLTLRVRHSGKKRLQTVKAEGEGVFTRREWECEIASDRPDITALPPLKKLKDAKLKAVFETVVTRSIFLLNLDGSEIELALDHGTLKAGRRRAPICEIELELKSGSVEKLIAAAKRLADAVPAAFEMRAKSSRGYALAAGEKPGPVGANDIALDEEMSCAAAFRVLGKETLRHITANEDAVRLGQSEGVHQMRVGLRRLRAAFSLFKEMLADPQSQAVKAELKWLTGELGPARDLDVFVRESVTPLEESAREMTLLKKDMEQRRDSGFSRAKAALASERYRRLILDSALWLEGGAWRRDGDLLQAARRDRPVLSFAREVLTARHKKIVKNAKALKTLDTLQRHKLRIAIKKQRYAGEFFAALFTGKKKMAAALEKLQDTLGRLNDFSTHKKLAGEIVGKRNAQKSYAIGIVTGHEGVKFAASMRAAIKSARVVKTLKPYWA